MKRAVCVPCWFRITWLLQSEGQVEYNKFWVKGLLLRQPQGEMSSRKKQCNVFTSHTSQSDAITHPSQHVTASLTTSGHGQKMQMLVNQQCIRAFRNVYIFWNKKLIRNIWWTNSLCFSKYGRKYTAVAICRDLLLPKCLYYHVNIYLDTFFSIYSNTGNSTYSTKRKLKDFLCRISKILQSILKHTGVQ